MLKRLYPDIPVRDVSHQILIPRVDGQGSQVAGLKLMMLQDVDILKDNLLDHIPLPPAVPVDADHGGMGHIRPDRHIPHRDLPAPAVIVPAAPVDGHAVV